VSEIALFAYRVLILTVPVLTLASVSVSGFFDEALSVTRMFEPDN
jgi:hypothetical protein